MTDSATLKVNWAAKHIFELNEVLRKTRPFPFVLKTNTQTGDRVLGCEKNEAVVDLIALLCGDAVHNLRAALDHAYWEILSPLCRSDRERKNIQFPFAEEADRLDKAIRERLGQRAGTGFYCALRRLAPYGDLGGNIPLFLIHHLDIADKHRLLLPAVDESTHSFKWLDTVDSSHPWKGWSASVTLSEQAEIKWTGASVPFRDQLGVQISEHEFKRVLDVPIDVVMPVTLQENIILKLPPVVPMLHQMLNMTRETIRVMRAGAASY